MGLIDDWMPAADETSRHSIVIEAPVDEVWQALFRTDLTRHPVTASLLALRSLPSFVLSPRQTLQRARHTRGSGGIGLKAILSSEFVLLDERPPREVVFGVTGQFWRPAGNLTTSDPATARTRSR